MNARIRRWCRAAFGVLLSAVLGLGGAALAGPAAADESCAKPQRFFAIDAQTGQLAEVPFCANPQRLGTPVTIDGGDWRVYRELTAARDGDAVVLYAITAEGHLQWRRQPAAGAAFGAPVEVGASIDWSQVTSLFAPHAGDLHGISDHAMRTFRHVGWATGDPTITEIDPLFPYFYGRPMSAADWGRRGEANVGRLHFRVWRIPYVWNAAGFADAWYPSGGLPEGVSGVTGEAPYLFGLDATGGVVSLRQPAPRPAPPRLIWDCALFNPRDWQVSASQSGHFNRLVVPTSDGPRPAPAPPAPAAAKAPAAPAGSGVAGRPAAASVVTPRVTIKPPAPALNVPVLGEVGNNMGQDCGDDPQPWEWQ